MKLKVIIKLEDKTVEKIVEYDINRLDGKKGYSVQNQLRMRAEDVAGVFVDIGFEVLDGQLKGTNELSHLYFREPFKINNIES